MKIIIDGDACPSIPLIELLAKKYEMGIIIFCDINHCIYSEYSEVKIVDSGFQSVDMYVVNNTNKDDIVITQDYGVAALCLAKDSIVISPYGIQYTNDNIERMLEDRHVSKCIRDSGGKVKSQKKRTEKDEAKFLLILEEELKKVSIKNSKKI